MATTVLKETIKNYTVKGSNVHTAFLDLSKAFDKINHDVLISKLIQKGYPAFFIKILYFMFKNQFVNVSYNDISSSWWKVGNGVRQGGILSPILFNIYIDEILETISSMNVGCKLMLIRNNVQGYADDLVLLSPTSAALQVMIDKVMFLIRKLCLVLNEDKSVYMIFRCKRFKDFNFLPLIKVNDLPLKIVSNYKYLGMELSSDLCNKIDIERCGTSLLKQFYSIFRRFSFADTDTLLFLFKTHCISLYGSEIWLDQKGCSKEYNELAVT